MKPSCQEARFSQKSEIQLKGTKVRASSHSSNAERVMFGKSGVMFLPRHLQVMWSQLRPHQGFIRETNGPVSAPQLAFQEPVHTVGLHCAFFTAWAPCVWELFARVKIMHDPIFSRLFTSWRVEIPGGEKKKKKLLDYFSSTNCSLRQVNVVKNIHKYSDSSLTKYQDIWIYSSVSSPQAFLVISGSLTSANVFCFTETQSQTWGLTGPERVK